MIRSFQRSRLASLLLVAALIGGCGAAGGSDAASYTAKDLVTEQRVSVTTLRGAPVVLVSWATWCTNCDKVLSDLQRFATSTEASGVKVVAVNIDAADVIDEINAKIARHGLTTSLWRDKQNEFKRAFGALGVPTTVVLDTNGAVTALFAGTVDFSDQHLLDSLSKARGT